MKIFQLGSRIRLAETFTDLIAGTLTDPTAITLKMRDPSGAETPYVYGGGQVLRDSVGVYHCDLTLGIPGKWFARWVAAGALVAVDEQIFTVSPSAFVAP